MTGFFHELRRRKVYRVAVAYGVVAWLVIQISATIFPAWELPVWALRLVIIMTLTGFPIALILAWAFDVTPAGIQPTASMEPGGGGAAGVTHRRRNLFLLATCGVVAAAAAGFFVLPRVSAHKIDKSIAVLPFENLSDEKENAYFADGIQDDVLTNLSKISDLKVISRTSVMGYRGNTKNVREIGKALGASVILEGSVRRSGNRVRVNVQLINAATDEHIWASDYDRDLTDVFAIQSDLAQKIAKELQAKLSPIEKMQLTRKPTENGEAYLAFVQAHNLFVPEDFGKLKQSEQLYERALQLDPNFALACASFSQLESWIFHSDDPNPRRREKARVLAERALQLQPDLPEAHLALGFSYYYGDRNYDAALQEFEIGQRGLPNHAEAHLALGAIQRRLGRWTESTSNLEKAVALDPNETWPLQNLAINYEMMRDFGAANRTLDQALRIDPQAFSLWELKAKVAIEEKGDFSIAEKGLDRLRSLPLDTVKQNKIAVAGMTIFFLQRKYAEALREAEKISDQSLGETQGVSHSKYLVIGAARKAMNDESGAGDALLKAKSLAETQIKQAPDDAARYCELAIVQAALGEKEAAVATAKHAMALLPESKDTFEGPVITESLANVYAMNGEVDRAVEILDGLLSRPSAVTVEMLKINPIWDGVRNDPRFQQLISKYGSRSPS